jgi:hypothetical protein
VYLIVLHHLLLLLLLLLIVLVLALLLALALIVLSGLRNGGAVAKLASRKIDRCSKLSSNL